MQLVVCILSQKGDSRHLSVWSPQNYRKAFVSELDQISVVRVLLSADRFQFSMRFPITRVLVLQLAVHLQQQLNALTIKILLSDVRAVYHNRKLFT